MPLFFDGQKIGKYRTIIVRLIKSCTSSFLFQTEHTPNPIPFSAPGDGVLLTTSQNIIGAINEAAGGTLPSHASTHEDGGSDEISVAGLSGTLADEQNAGWIDGNPISAPAPALNNVLQWNGANWVPAAISGGALTTLYNEDNTTTSESAASWSTKSSITCTAGTWVIWWSIETQVDWVTSSIVEIRLWNNTDSVEYARVSDWAHTNNDATWYGPAGLKNNLVFASSKNIYLQFGSRFAGGDIVWSRRGRLFAIKLA